MPTPREQLRISVYPTEIQVRDVLGHYWIRVFISVTGNCAPGHSWMYSGLVRRDAWTFRDYGFGVMRMPKGKPAVAEKTWADVGREAMTESKE